MSSNVTASQPLSSHARSQMSNSTSNQGGHSAQMQQLGEKNVASRDTVDTELCNDSVQDRPQEAVRVFSEDDYILESKV